MTNAARTEIEPAAGTDRDQCRSIFGSPWLPLVFECPHGTIHAIESADHRGPRRGRHLIDSLPDTPDESWRSLRNRWTLPDVPAGLLGDLGVGIALLLEFDDRRARARPGRPGVVRGLRRPERTGSAVGSGEASTSGSISVPSFGRRERSRVIVALQRVSTAILVNDFLLGHLG